MGASIGKHQLRLLVGLGCPWMVLVVPDKRSRSLVARGLLRESKTGATCITSAGLRALADEMDAGRVKDTLARLEAEAKARRAKIAARNRMTAGRLSATPGPRP